MVDLYFRIYYLFENTYTGRIVAAMVELFVLVGPYFLVSVFINATLKRYATGVNWLKFSNNETLAVLMGAMLGMLSPLPTYLAVPMAMSLIATGIPVSALAAFMVSSPLINPGIFILTWSQLGMKMAIARVISAFALALVAGVLAKLLQNKKEWPEIVKSKRSGEKRPLVVELRRSVLFLGRYFLISITLAAIVKALVPAEMVSRLLGGQAQMGLVMAIAIGVPFYSCGGAAIPLITTLSEMGMSNGSVLAFFIAGPATKLETMYAYKSALGIKIFIVYLLLMLIGAFVSGFVVMQL